MAAPNHLKLGLFALAALACAVVIALVLGANRWFQHTTVLETYFDESVQGLDVGSKVKYRGVVLGQVRRIGFTHTRYEQDRPLAARRRLVLVEADVRPELAGILDTADRSARQAEIARGLRVRLASQGLTGTSYLEMDYLDPAANPPLSISWTPEHFYVPSTRSTVTQLVDAARDGISRLQHLELEQTLARLNRLLDATTRQVEGLDAAGLARDAQRTLRQLQALPAARIGQQAEALLAELRDTNRHLRLVLDDPAWRRLPEDAAATLGRLRQQLDSPEFALAVTRLERAAGRTERLLGNGEDDIATTLENLRVTTDNLRDLSERARRNPAGTLLGGAPPSPRRTP